MTSKKVILWLVILMTGCSTEQTIEQSNQDSAPINVPVDLNTITDAIPQYEPRTRAGNPVEYEVLGKHYKTLSDSHGYIKKGMASWYGTKFHGKKTANGEIYNMYAMTAAHKTLPIPSYVQVTNLKNNRQVIVRINDRGPFHQNRLIDLSYAAATKLGIDKTGTGWVEVKALEADATRKTDRLIKSTKIQPQKGLLYLQLGAFSHLKNAQQLKQRLTSNKLGQTRIINAKKRNQVWYKVQLGPLSSVQRLEHKRQMLQKLGYQVIPLTD